MAGLAYSIAHYIIGYTGAKFNTRGAEDSNYSSQPPQEDQSDEEDEDSPFQGSGKLDALKTLTDEEANEIYQKVSALSQGRKGYITKNWSDDEARLLKWAVLTYTRQKGISNFNLVRLAFPESV